MYVYIHALYGIKIDIYHNSICHGDLIHLILLLMTEWNTVFVYSVPVYDFIIFCKAYIQSNCALCYIVFLHTCRLARRMV